MRFRHSTRPHRSGLTEHVLDVYSDDGRGRLRWFHVSDDEAWVTMWVANPQRAGLGSALLDVVTGQRRVEGIDLAPYRWFSATPGNWGDPFRAWAEQRPGITHRPRDLDRDTIMGRSGP